MIWHNNKDFDSFTKLFKIDKEYLAIFNHYLKYLFVNLVLNDFITIKTAKEFILGYQDPLLNFLKTINYSL